MDTYVNVAAKQGEENLTLFWFAPFSNLELFLQQDPQ